MLIGIGLYDTWLEFFAPLYTDPAAREQGGSSDAVTGLFLDAAVVLHSMGYTGAALAAIEAGGIEGLPPQRPGLLDNTGQDQLVNDTVHAEQRLRAAIGGDPYHAGHHHDLANLLARLPGREMEAMAAYDQAILLSPPDHKAHLHRARLRARFGDPGGAMQDLVRALHIKPSAWQALRDMGKLQLAAGDAAGALASYEEALRHQMRDADLHASAGMAASELGDSARAISHGHSAIALNPRHAGAHSSLAAEWVALGQLTKAYHHIQLASAYDPDPRYRESLAVIMRLL